MKLRLKGILSAIFVVGGVLSLAGCSSSSKSSSSSSSSSSSKAKVTTGASKDTNYTSAADLKKNYDIVVVGGGGAGMASAIEAHDKGAKVAIFEKMPEAGGNTWKSSGGMNASETKYQKKQGIKDSNDLFYKDTMKGGGYKNDPKLLRYFVDHSAAAINWLDSLGIHLTHVSFSGGASVARIHQPANKEAVGEYLTPRLISNVKKRNIPFFVNAKVQKITESGNHVNGIKVMIDHKVHTVKAKAVIVTTGGFGHNKQMIAKYQPTYKNIVSTNSAGSTGDGIKMISALGGQLVQMKYIQLHPTVVQKTGMLISEGVRGAGAIMVNKDGKRFFNDMGLRDEVTNAERKQPGGYSYVLYDAGVAKRTNQVAFYQKKGVVIQGDTIAALAKKLGVDASTLQNTITTYNQGIKAKKDAFGRKTAMYQLNQGPYYAIKVAPGIHHTMGGVKINTKTQVLRKNGTWIKGLYAAGEVTGGLHGNNRIGGNAVADIIIYGHQAGDQASQYVK